MIVNAAGLWGQLTRGLRNLTGRQIMTLRAFLKTAFVVLAMTTALTTLSFAQNEDGSFDLGTIVLRGELQERTLQDSATSVVVETGEELEARSEQDLYAVLERTPGVTNAGNNTGIAIRGIDQRGLGGGGSAVVSIQVDGIALPSTQSTFFGPYSTFDLEQIEVLRGPQSTQQGRNALAGAVVIRSKDPSFDREAKVRVGFGSRNTYETAFAFNVPFIKDRLALRFSAENYQSDGWIANPTLGIDDFDERDASTIRAKLRWDPTDSLSFVASYTYASNVGSWAEADNAFFPAVRVNQSDFNFRHGSEHQILGLRAKWDINTAWTLETESTLYYQSYFRNADSDFGPAPDAFFVRGGGSEAFEQDIELKFDYDTLRGVVGFFYTDIDASNPTIINSVFRNNTFNTLRDFGNGSENYALFADVDLDIGAVPGLTLNVGARYDIDTVTILRQEVQTINGTVNVIVPRERASETFEAFLPKVSLSYDWNDRITTAFTVQRAYRAGGTSFNLLTGQSVAFDPEFATNYEFAFRGEFLDGDLIANANFFYLDWTDQQVGVQLSGNPLDAVTTNAGKSHVIGVEANVDAQITSRFDMYAGVGYAKSEFDEFIFNGQNLAGNSFGEPEWTAAIGGSYELGRGFSVAADASYTGEAFDDVFNRPNEIIDDRLLFNARLTYEDGNGLTAVLYARNIFDEDYITGIRDIGARRFVSVGEPLTIGAFLQKEF
ncbi:MAG: TonB-dependent receptor [Pseudomonadota bacterium]